MKYVDPKSHSTLAETCFEKLLQENMNTLAVLNQTIKGVGYVSKQIISVKKSLAKKNYGKSYVWIPSSQSIKVQT